jgi:superfamily II DNA or RNA helicase
MDGGHLVEPTIYVARSPDDQDLGLNSYGEFSDSSATAAGIQIVGDVVQEWIGKTRQHFGGPVKTIVFSPTVEHGRELCAAFNAEGFNFQQISYLDRDDDERARKIAEFRQPDSTIHGLISCGVLTKGFDVPDVRVGISCKPYRKSLSSHMQEIGRVMRSHPGKDKALWLCHSGNVERFALDTFDVWENGAGPLDQAEKRDATPRDRNPVEREKVVCPECAGAMRGPTCMACGYERPARSDVHHVEGELKAFDMGASGMTPRDGLRAPILQEPRKVWEAALAYTMANTRKGDAHARRWAYGVFRGIYPTNKLPGGWFDAPRPALVDTSAASLIDREIKRFRKRGKA